MSTAEDNIVTVETVPTRPGRSTLQVPLDDGMTLSDLFEIIDVPGDAEAVMVNGGHVKPDYRLQNGDRVVIIPFMSGG